MSIDDPRWSEPTTQLELREYFKAVYDLTDADVSDLFEEHWYDRGSEQLHGRPTRDVGETMADDIILQDEDLAWRFESGRARQRA